MRLHVQPRLDMTSIPSSLLAYLYALPCLPQHFYMSCPDILYMADFFSRPTSSLLDLFALISVPVVTLSSFCPGQLTLCWLSTIHNSRSWEIGHIVWKLSGKAGFCRKDPSKRIHKLIKTSHTKFKSGPIVMFVLEQWMWKLICASGVCCHTSKFNAHNLMVPPFRRWQDFAPRRIVNSSNP